MCASSSLNSDPTESSSESSGNGNNLKQLAHFDLQLAKKLKQKQQAVNMRQKSEPEENYLILFLQDLMRIACIATSGCCDTLKLAGLDLLNVMRLHSPESAILSAVIFNAIIIVLLIPLSLRGVRYRPSSASKLLSRNLYVYGLGGIVAPFIGIKLIDLIVQFVPGMS